MINKLLLAAALSLSSECFAMQLATSTNLLDRYCRGLVQGKGINHADGEGITPLMQLVSEPSGNQKRIIYHFVKNMGAAINQGDTQGRTALWYAIDAANADAVAALVEIGADLEKHGNGKRFYPVVEALMSRRLWLSKGYSSAGYIRVIKQLAAYNVSLDEAPSSDKRPLVMAAHQGWDEGLKLLIELGARADITSNGRLFYLECAAPSYVEPFKDSPRCKIIREAVSIGKDPLLEATRKNPKSYISLLPADLCSWFALNMHNLETKHEIEKYRSGIKDQ